MLFLDDDDVLRPAALEVLTRALAGSPGAVAAIGARATISSDGQRTNVRHAKRGQTRHIWPEVLLLWFSAWFSVPGQILFRVSALRAVDGWRRELIVGEDWELQLRLSRLGPTVLVPDVVFEWRLHGGQWRPRDTEVVEDRNRRRFVDGLSGRERELGARVLRARELLVLAEEHHTRREFGRSFLLTAGAARTVPVFLVSPLTGHAFRRLLAASLVGAVIGRRGFVALRHAKRLGQRALGRELPEYRAIPHVGTSGSLSASSSSPPRGSVVDT